MRGHKNQTEKHKIGEGIDKLILEILCQNLLMILLGKNVYVNR